MYCTVLYCTILVYNTTLYALYYTLLHRTVLHSTVLHCSAVFITDHQLQCALRANMRNFMVKLTVTAFPTQKYVRECFIVENSNLMRKSYDRPSVYNLARL